MPVITIFPSGLEKFSKEQAASLVFKVSKRVFKIKELGLTQLNEISVFVVKAMGTASDFTVTKVLVDKKPERTKDVLKKIAKIISTLISKDLGSNEVFVETFDHENSGFYKN